MTSISPITKTLQFAISFCKLRLLQFFLKNLCGIDKFKQEFQNEMPSVSCSQISSHKNDLLTSHFQLLYKPLRTYGWLSTTRLVFQWTGSYPPGYPKMDLLRDLHCTTRKQAPPIKRTLSPLTVELFFLKRLLGWRNTQNTIFKCLYLPTLGKDRKALLWRKEQVKTVTHV